MDDDNIKKDFQRLRISFKKILNSKNNELSADWAHSFIGDGQSLADKGELDFFKIFLELDWHWFFTQVGLNQGMSFFTELYRRIEEGFLPPIDTAKDVIWFFESLFDNETEKNVNLKAGSFQKIDQIFIDENINFSSFLERPILLSLETITQRICGLALDPLVAKRLRNSFQLQENFLNLGRITFLDSPEMIHKKYVQTIQDCEKSIRFIKILAKQDGASLSLTYRLLQIEQLIVRLKLLLNLFENNKSIVAVNNETRIGFFSVCSLILIEHFETAKLRQFLVHNLEILAYQITVISERTGEHYVSKNSTQLFGMWIKAIKGAFIVAALVFIKIQLSKIGYPPLIEALTYGTLYAVGFVLIHLTGGVLATKQPAMTASTLAAAMDQIDSSIESLNKLADSIISILRTQIAALLGNLLFAFPFALLFSLPFLLLDKQLVSFHKADMIVESLHPYFSLSLVFAAIAGVCLFLSGLIAGLASNWFAFNKISDRLKGLFPSKRAEKTIHFLDINFGVLTGNIILGYMLGSMGAIGKMTGLPLDIRHVTFASGSFGIGWIQKEELMSWPSFLVIVFGVVMIGIVNLIVSFSLSLLTAMKSRKIKFKQGRVIFKILISKLLKKPAQLFIHLKSKE